MMLPVPAQKDAITHIEPYKLTSLRYFSFSNCYIGQLVNYTHRTVYFSFNSQVKKSLNYVQARGSLNYTAAQQGQTPLQVEVTPLGYME
jgi:hypothetical protein